MNTALIVILLIMANLTLYWLFYGKKKFEEKWELSPQENDKLEKNN